LAIKQESAQHPSLSARKKGEVRWSWRGWQVIGGKGKELGVSVYPGGRNILGLGGVGGCGGGGGGGWCSGVLQSEFKRLARAKIRGELLPTRSTYLSVLEFVERKSWGIWADIDRGRDERYRDSRAPDSVKVSVRSVFYRSPHKPPSHSESSNVRSSKLVGAPLD